MKRVKIPNSKLYAGSKRLSTLQRLNRKRLKRYKSYILSQSMRALREVN